MIWLNSFLAERRRFSNYHFRRCPLRFHCSPTELPYRLMVSSKWKLSFSSKCSFSHVHLEITPSWYFEKLFSSRSMLLQHPALQDSGIMPTNNFIRKLCAVFDLKRRSFPVKAIPSTNNNPYTCAEMIDKMFFSINFKRVVIKSTWFEDSI